MHLVWTEVANGTLPTSPRESVRVVCILQSQLSSEIADTKRNSPSSLDIRLHQTLGVHVVYMLMKDRTAADSICKPEDERTWHNVVHGNSFTSYNIHFGRVFDTDGKYIPFIRHTSEEKMDPSVQLKTLWNTKKPITPFLFPAMPPMTNEEEEAEVREVLLQSL